MSLCEKQQILLAVERGEISSLQAFKAFRKIQDPGDVVFVPDFQKQSFDGKQRMEEILRELNYLIGMREIKQLVKEIFAFAEIQKRREKEHLHIEPLVLHMIFSGNPGTGKTTVARILGKVFHALDILERGHLVEVERADLVGEYIGQTAQKTREQIKKAHGGILFIDEAYSLARGGEKDFGKECIDVLVKSMEDHKNEFILILAGYQQEMEQFLLMNPGLRSRFPIHVGFSDFSQQELLQIAEQICAKRQYQMTEACRIALVKMIITMQATKSGNFGNARSIRNIVEKAMRRQAVRLIRKPTNSREELILIEPDDLLEVKE